MHLLFTVTVPFSHKEKVWEYAPSMPVICKKDGTYYGWDKGRKVKQKVLYVQNKNVRCLTKAEVHMIWMDTHLRDLFTIKVVRQDAN